MNIDINHQDGSGKVCLFYFSLSTLTSPFFQTALHYAAARGYKEICVILLKHHASINTLFIILRVLNESFKPKFASPFLK